MSDKVSERPRFVRSLWALTVLCLLRERPLHPYEVRLLARERKKDQFLDLKRGSLYHAVDQLQRAGLIEVIETLRPGRRPERTVYGLTPTGEHELLEWLADLLRTPTDDAREFFAALSFVTQLAPEVVANQLELRAEQLRTRTAVLDQALMTLTPQIGKVLLLESEFACSAQKAELAWVRSLIEEIRSEKIAWDPVGMCSEKPQSRTPTSKKG